jgi:hypothetical protein
MEPPGAPKAEASWWDKVKEFWPLALLFGIQGPVQVYHLIRWIRDKGRKDPPSTPPAVSEAATQVTLSELKSEFQGISTGKAAPPANNRSAVSAPPVFVGPLAAPCSCRPIKGAFMSLPSLDQLVSFFRDRALPKGTDAVGSIAKDIRPCAEEDALQWEILQYPDGDDNLLFLEIEAARSSSGFRKLDDTHYRRLMQATGGLAYKPEGKDGKPNPVSKAVLDLCREEAKPGLSGVYVTDKIVPVQSDRDILANNPGVPALREVPFRFTREEIIAIVRGVGLNASHYAVDGYDPSRFLVFPDLNAMEQIVGFVESQKKPATPEALARRAEMAKAFRRCMGHEINQAALADEQLRVPPWPSDRHRRAGRDDGQHPRHDLDAAPKRTPDARAPAVGPSST